MKQDKTKSKINTILQSSKVVNLEQGQPTPKKRLCIYAVSFSYDFNNENCSFDRTQNEREDIAYDWLFNQNPEPFEEAIIKTLGFINNELQDECKMVVFSPWTTSFQNRGQIALNQFSNIFPILFERRNGRQWVTNIIWRNNIVLEAVQDIAYMDAIRNRTSGFLNLVEKINNQHETENRYWTHPISNHNFLLLVCGEVNIILGNRHSSDLGWHSLINSQVGPINNIDGVLNPSHTYFHEQAVRDKQGFLGTQYQYLITCSNRYLRINQTGGIQNRHVFNNCWQQGQIITDSISQDINNRINAKIVRVCFPHTL